LAGEVQKQNGFTQQRKDPASELADYCILTGSYDDAAITLNEAGQTRRAKLVKTAQLTNAFDHPTRSKHETISRLDKE